MTNETDLLTQLRSSRHSAFHGLTDALCEKAADEIERLRIALVNAAVPLEAINMTTTFKMLSPEMQDGIHMALTSIRDALGVNADAE